GQDTVPTVPPIEFGFQHVGCELKCESGGNFSVKGQPAAREESPVSTSGFFDGLIDRFRRLASPPASPSFRADLLGQLHGFLPAGIGDYLPDRYWPALGDAEP